MNATQPIFHDDLFVPDFVLRVNKQEFTQSCMTKSEVILVNNTSPGPEIRLTEGNIYWIRVYNDMDKENVTMVSQSPALRSVQESYLLLSIGMVFRWLYLHSQMALPELLSGLYPLITILTTSLR